MHAKSRLFFDFKGCENLVNEQYRAPPVLTDPMLIDQVNRFDRIPIVYPEFDAYLD